MNITQHFTLEEFEKSEKAEIYKLDNSMPARYFRNLERLCEHVLEPLRSALQCPIVISSGYRCKGLNEIVKGSENSQHTIGCAADFTCSKMDIAIRVFKEKYLRYDQCIVHDTFIHISYNNHICNRNQFIDLRKK